MLREIVKAHDKKLRQFAIKNYGENGEDYLQNVYLKLWDYPKHKLEEIKQKGYLLYFLHRMITQQHIGRIRKEKQFDPVEILATTEPTTLDFEIDRKELTFEQAIFLEYYEKGFSMLQISEMFELSYKTVTKQLKSIPCNHAPPIEN